MAAKLPSAKMSMGSAKAKKILSDGTVRGNPLTPGQKGLFGAIAGGAKTGRPKAPAAPKAPRAPKMGLANPIGMRPTLGSRTRNAIKRGL